VIELPADEVKSDGFVLVEPEPVVAPPPVESEPEPAAPVVADDLPIDDEPSKKKRGKKSWFADEPKDG
jgi:hypothetical protein